MWNSSNRENESLFLVSRELGLGVFPWYFHASVITRAYPPPCISNTSARSRIYFIVLLLRPAEKYSPYFHIFKHFYAPISIILFYPFHVSQILPPPPRSPTIYSASRFHQPRMSNNCSTNVVVVVVDTSADNLFINASPISARRFRLRIYKTGKRFKRKWWPSALIATQLTPLYPITIMQMRFIDRARL